MLRILLLVYNWAKLSHGRIFYNKILKIYCNLLNIVLKAKNKSQNGGFALIFQEKKKFKLQSTLSSECVLLLPLSKVKNLNLNHYKTGSSRICTFLFYCLLSRLMTPLPVAYWNITFTYFLYQLFWNPFTIHLEIFLF
jgi:hypothetical protein